MYINNINILIYVLVIFTGIISGQFLDWYKIRLEEHKKIDITFIIKDDKPFKISLDIDTKISEFLSKFSE